MLLISQPTMQFVNPRLNTPVASGKMYFGEPNTDPKVEENRVEVYYIDLLGNTVVLPQPVMLSASGVPIYLDRAIEVLSLGAVSIRVDDRNDIEVYLIDSYSGTDTTQPAMRSVASVEALRETRTRFNGEVLWLAGYYDGDNSGAGPVSGTFTETPTDDSGVNFAGVGTQWVRQLDGFVTPEMFGESSDPSQTSDAVEDAINYSISNPSIRFDWGAGSKTLNRQLNFTGITDITGAGVKSVNINTTFVGHALVFTVNSQTENKQIGGFACNLSATPANNDNTSFIRIQGNSTFLQYFDFYEISGRNFESLITVAKDTYASTAGYNESSVNWNRFKDLNLRGGTYASKYLVKFEKGSGTGNSFTGIKGRLTKLAAAFLRVEDGGVNAACGDIIWNGANLQGADTKLLSIGAGVAYKSRISIVSTQFDAGATIPVSDDSGEVTGLTLVGNNMGGFADVWSGMPAVQRCQIHDKGISEWRGGHFAEGIATEVTTAIAFTIACGFSTGFYGVLTVDGQVGGVGTGIVLSRFVVRRTSSTPVLTVLETVRSPTTAGFFTVDYILSADGLIKCQLSFAATGGLQSRFSAQLHLMGGRVKASGGERTL